MVDDPTAQQGLENFDSVEDNISNNTEAPTLEINSTVREDPVDLDEFLIDNYGGLLIGLHSNELPKRPFLIAFHHFRKNCVQLKHWLNIFHEVCLKYADAGLRFVIGDFEDGPLLNFKWHKWEYEDEFYLRNMHSTPWIYAMDVEGRLYSRTGFVEVEGLTGYAKQLLNDELFTSEPLPQAEAAAGEVLVAVGKNFVEIVLENDKDVFLTLYAPWSVFSMELLPLLDELACLLKAEGKIAIVKTNADANYVPLELYPYSYPKCCYIPRKHKGTSIEYRNGPRNLDNLLKFIATNATDELIAYDRSGLRKSN